VCDTRVSFLVSSLGCSTTNLCILGSVLLLSLYQQQFAFLHTVRGLSCSRLLTAFFCTGFLSLVDRDDDHHPVGVWCEKQLRQRIDDCRPWLSFVRPERFLRSVRRVGSVNKGIIYKAVRLGKSKSYRIYHLQIPHGRVQHRHLPLGHRCTLCANSSRNGWVTMSRSIFPNWHSTHASPPQRLRSTRADTDIEVQHKDDVVLLTRVPACPHLVV